MLRPLLEIATTTELGRQLVAAAPSPLHETFAAKLQSLSLEERQQIETTLQRIVEMMEAEDLEAAPMLATGPLTAGPAEVANFLEEPGPDAKPGCGR